MLCYIQKTNICSSYKNWEDLGFFIGLTQSSGVSHGVSNLLGAPSFPELRHHFPVAASAMDEGRQLSFGVFYALKWSLWTWNSNQKPQLTLSPPIHEISAVNMPTHNIAKLYKTIWREPRVSIWNKTILFEPCLNWYFHLITGMFCQHLYNRGGAFAAEKRDVLPTWRKNMFQLAQQSTNQL